MLKIYIPNTSKQSIGGGFSFFRNIQKALKEQALFVNSWQECDVVLITGATMTSRDEITQAKEAGKKVVFRVDNIPKDSRNRGTAFSRMVDFAKMADFIIFQSEWAKDYAGWWFEENGVSLGGKSAVIYNGVDKDIFNSNGRGEEDKERYLYVQYNRDENKRTPEAFYLFHQAFRKNKEAQLWVVGKFSPEFIEYGFDFFAGEDVSYMGIIEDRMALADMMRTCRFLLFPAFADASSNLLTEGLACGMEPVGINPVGGSIEIVKRAEQGIIPSLKDMGMEYLEVINSVVSK